MTLKVEVYRWRTVVVTLSLDLAGPYLATMGLEMPSGFREGVRGIIEELRGRGVDPEVSAEYALAILQWSEERYGAGFAEGLYRWGTGVFDYGETDDNGAALLLWQSIVTHRGYRSGPVPPAAPVFIERVRAVLAGVREADVDESRPATEWDKGMYAWIGYDEDVYTPMTSVALTVVDCRFRAAWTAVRREMGAGVDMAAVKAWGTAVARQMGMPVEGLGEPGAWPDLPEATMAG